MAEIKRTVQLGASDSLTLSGEKAEMFVIRDGTVVFDTLEINGQADSLQGETLVQDQEYWSIGYTKFAVNSGSAGTAIIFIQS
jgi:hypothetical protein